MSGRFKSPPKERSGKRDHGHEEMLATATKLLPAVASGDMIRALAERGYTTWPTNRYIPSTGTRFDGYIRKAK